jgi:hypothetical protein
VDANTAPASTLTYGGGQAIYSYFSAGVRLGQFRMPSSRNVAPREAWRIDLAWGRYSNLKTIYGYASEYWPASGQTVTAYFTATQPRLIMEGFLTIPSTPFLLGFEANVKTKPNPANLFGRNGLLPPHPSVERLAAGPYLLPAHDDLRFILGARFDAAALAGKFVGTR